jgi:hypothetical protein
MAFDGHGDARIFLQPRGLALQSILVGLIEVGLIEIEEDAIADILLKVAHASRHDRVLHHRRRRGCGGGGRRRGSDGGRRRRRRLFGSAGSEEKGGSQGGQFGRRRKLGHFKYSLAGRGLDSETGQRFSDLALKKRIPPR